MRNLLLRVTVTANGHFGSLELGTIAGMVKTLSDVGVDVVFVATDGDTALDSLHVRTQKRYLDPAFGEGVPTLAEAARRITESSEVELGNFPGWICVAVSDFLHLAKAIRLPLCKWVVKGSKDGIPAPGLAVGPGLPWLTSADGLIIQEVEPSTSDVTSVAHVQDVPALKLVHPATLARLLREGHWSLARFVLPFCFLEMAIRAEGMSKAVRATCVEVSFQVLPVIGYPCEDDEGSRVNPMWLRMQRIRAMSLFGALFQVLVNLEPGTSVALWRIGSHSVEVEAPFGLVRARLGDDGSFPRWRSAEVN
jgi:hypothetical protein